MMAFFSKADNKGFDRYFIELDDVHKSWLIYKWPDQAIRSGTRLTVDADYMAVFTNKGKVVAWFGPGGYVLDQGASRLTSALADSLTGRKYYFPLLDL